MAKPAPTTPTARSAYGLMLASWSAAIDFASAMILSAKA
jgi:hypothetical protein